MAAITVRGARTHNLRDVTVVIPPPRMPLVRYHGVLAPNSPWRVAVVPAPVAGERCAAGTVRTCTAAVPPVSAGAADDPAPVLPRVGARIPWANLPGSVRGIDALRSVGRGGRLKMIAVLTERAGIARILEPLGVLTEGAQDAARTRRSVMGRVR